MFRLINNLKNKKGFTLIELIVVLAVLAIVLAIAVPRFLGVKEQAKKDADKSTLGLIAKAAELYYAKGDISGMSSYEGTSGAAISGDLLDLLEADFPDLEFQSKTSNNELDDVILKFDTSNGKAETTFNNITYK